MNHRFHRRADLRALQGRHTASTLLTEGICDANIDGENPGDIRVHLWREWQAILGDLTRIGPVWSIVRNRQATLAVLGSYPDLTFARQPIGLFAPWRQRACLQLPCVAPRRGV